MDEAAFFSCETDTCLAPLPAPSREALRVAPGGNKVDGLPPGHSFTRILSQLARRAQTSLEAETLEKVA